MEGAFDEHLGGYGDDTHTMTRNEPNVKVMGWCQKTEAHGARKNGFRCPKMHADHDSSQQPAVSSRQTPLTTLAHQLFDKNRRRHPMKSLHCTQHH